jgi:hypothetical protein
MAAVNVLVEQYLIGFYRCDIPVQKVNVVCLELLQAVIDRLADVLWIIADFSSSFRSDKVAKLGGQEDLFMSV